VLTLEQLRDPSDAEVARFDVAEVDLICAVGLPGSTRLDVLAHLAWIDRAAAWVRHDTLGTIEDFHRRPEQYGNSEATFRIVSMMSVLQKGLGVRYNPSRIDNPSPSTDSRDDFIHGIIEGPGGTCASIPVLFVAVGRRLGYPLKLVTTIRHLFARWEDPAGERLNIEITNKGLNVHPDDFYRVWPVPAKDAIWWWRLTRFLRSLTPREEVAHAWQKRAFCLQANGQKGAAVKAFAIAWSLVPDDFQSEYFLAHALQEWMGELQPRITADLARPEVEIPRRWYPGLPLELERHIIELDVLEQLLTGLARGRERSGPPKRVTIEVLT